MLRRREKRRKRGEMNISQSETDFLKKRQDHRRITRMNEMKKKRDKEDGAGGEKKKKKRVVKDKMSKKACFHCRKGHRKCNDERPCKNCVRLNKECFDEVENMTETKDVNQIPAKSTPYAPIFSFEPNVQSTSNQELTKCGQCGDVLIAVNETCISCGAIVGTVEASPTYQLAIQQETNISAQNIFGGSLANISSLFHNIQSPNLPETGTKVTFTCSWPRENGGYGLQNLVVENASLEVSRMLGIETEQTINIPLATMFPASVPIDTLEAMGQKIVQLSEGKSDPSFVHLVLYIQRPSGVILYLRLQCGIFTDSVHKMPILLFCVLLEHRILSEEEKANLGTQLLPTIEKMQN